MKSRGWFLTFKDWYILTINTSYKGRHHIVWFYYSSGERCIVYILCNTTLCQYLSVFSKSLTLTSLSLLFSESIQHSIVISTIWTGDVIALSIEWTPITIRSWHNPFNPHTLLRAEQMVRVRFIVRAPYMTFSDF